MKNEITIQARRFPVTVEDQRSGERHIDTVIVTKEQLQASQIVGQSSKELIHRLYNRQGFRVLDIGTPTKHAIAVDLEELLQLHGEAEPLEQ